MNKHNPLSRLLIYLFAALVLAPPIAAADVTIQITGGREAALPIAVVPFGVEGAGQQPPQDVAKIIGDDLQRTGKFQPLPRTDLVAKPHTEADVKFANWRALGADNLVIGQVSHTAGGGYKVHFELFDVYTGQALAGQNTEYTIARADQLRTLAHQLSDIIYKTLTGNPAGFTKRIAYVDVSRNAGGARYRLMVADSDGEDAHAILTSKESILSPTWSPDRKRLAYVSFENKRSEVFIQNVETGKRRLVAKYPGINSAPAWSPDGRDLALTLSKDGSPNIYILNLRTNKLRQLTHSLGIDTEASFAADGKTIVFTSDRGGNPQIYRMPVSGGPATRLTFEGKYNATPSLSPDGKTLVMVHRENGAFRIAVQDLQTGLMSVLTNGPLDESPSFSPGGSIIVYSGLVNGHSALMSVSAHGNAQEHLQVSSDDLREPAWSPR